MAERNGDAAEIGRRAAEAAVGTARQGVQQLGDGLREAALSLVDDQKGRLADTIHGFALAFRRSADTLQEEQSAMASRCAGQAAMQLDRMAAALRQRRLGDILADAEGLARRQPALFIAGTLAAGFLLARLIAASPAPEPEPAGDNAWQEGPRPAPQRLTGAGVAQW
jgi:hypothetical protein